jgi:H+/Cl- antiporter ClcA
VNEIYEEMLSLKFLILVVITSIILNLIASYLKILLDKGISKLNSSYHEKMKLKEEEENKFDFILTESEEFRNIHRSEAIFERIRSVWFLILAMFAFSILTIVELLKDENNISNTIYLLSLGFISLTISMKYVISSTKKWNRAFKASNANKTE